jgi:hypothetical protein
MRKALVQERPGTSRSVFSWIAYERGLTPVRKH